MNIDLEFEQLEEMMQNEGDVTLIHAKFITLLELPIFSENSIKHHDEFLENVVKQAMESIGAKHYAGLQLFYIRKFKFYHGTFFADNMPATILYFEDLKMGLVSFVKNSQGKGTFYYLRFGGIEKEDGEIMIGKHSNLTH